MEDVRRNRNEVVELFFDALEVPDIGYYDRRTGEVDMQAAHIVEALLRAGWTPPGKTSSRDQWPVEVHGPVYGEPHAIGMFRPLDEETP